MACGGALFCWGHDNQLPASRSLLDDFDDAEPAGSDHDHDRDLHLKAFTFYLRAAREDPNDHEAAYNVGVCYRDGEGCGKSYERSVEWLFLAAEGGHREALCALGSAYEEGQGLPKSYEKAADYYRRANEVGPSMGLSTNVPDAYYNLGLLYEEGDGVPQDDKAAAALYRKCLAVDPSHVYAKHFLAVLEADDTVLYADHDYVTHLFDDYADTFDKDLVQGLQYRAPEYLNTALVPVFEARQTLRVTLDAGGGTGLMGPHLRPHTRELWNCDLSSGMVDKSRELKDASSGKPVYDSFFVGDLIEVMRDAKGKGVDAIVAADVFVYFGDMLEAFETARSALAPDGPMLFAFTSEVMPPTRGRWARKKCKGWSIQSSGRFCHTKEYLYALAKQTGFTVLHYEKIVPRMESGKPIRGQLMIFEGAGARRFPKGHSTAI